jgi:hypothetical protein
MNDKLVMELVFKHTSVGNLNEIHCYFKTMIRLSRVRWAVR